jgi:hypothetical protein
VPVPTQVKTKPRIAPPVPKATPGIVSGGGAPDPLAKLASVVDGPSSLGDALSSTSETAQGPTLQGAGADATARGGQTGGGEGQTVHTAPEVGGGGADPLKWVMGPSAPSISGLRVLAIDLEKEALAHDKRAPKTPEGNAFLDAVRGFESELGQFSALCSLAKMSGKWSAVGMHAATQLTDSLSAVASLVEQVVERPSSELPGRVKSDADRLKAGRQAYLSGSAPYAQSQDPKRKLLDL